MRQIIIGRKPWASHEPDWQPPQDRVIHARLDDDPTGYTVCETGGAPVVPEGSVAVLLTHPQGSWGDVTCQACLDWRHA